MTRWLLVTGGARRLGRAIADAAARGGWNILLHYHTSAEDAQTAADAISRLGVRCQPVQAELSSPADIIGLFDRAQNLIGGAITGLVNSASTFIWDDIGSFDEAGFLRHQTVNALAPVLLSKQLHQRMPAETDGVIVNILDFKLENPNPDHLSYTLSKYTLSGATAILARSFAPRVRVNAVSPGYILPAPNQTEDDFEARARNNPLRRRASPDDVALAVTFLLNCPSVTGQNIVVDCGLHFSSLERDVAISP